MIQMGVGDDYCVKVLRVLVGYAVELNAVV